MTQVQGYDVVVTRLDAWHILDRGSAVSVQDAYYELIGTGIPCGLAYYYARCAYGPVPECTLTDSDGLIDVEETFTLSYINAQKLSEEEFLWGLS